MKRWFIPAAARARGQSNDLNRGILASNLFNCHNEVINAPPIPSISRCIHIVYRHKNVWEYQWSNFIYNCMSTFLHYVRCKDALLDCPWRWKVQITNLGWWNSPHKCFHLMTSSWQLYHGVCLVGVFPHSVSTRRDPCVRVCAPLTLVSPLTRKQKSNRGDPALHLGQVMGHLNWCMGLSALLGSNLGSWIF